MHPVEMSSLFGQQGSWKGTSKITMMAVFEERKKKKCRSIANLEITSIPALQGSIFLCLRSRPRLCSLHCFPPSGHHLLGTPPLSSSPSLKSPTCLLRTILSYLFYHLDTFPLFEAYRQGLAYIRQHNANTSVTTGGPLFDKNSLEVSEQLQSLKPKDQPAPVPIPLPLFSEAYHQVEASIKDLSEDLWAMLGDAIPIQQQEPIDLTVETRS
jgi:hypothetical protein